jgi:diguanylate cyclase (GGDEF)-like protein
MAIMTNKNNKLRLLAVFLLAALTVVLLAGGTHLPAAPGFAVDAAAPAGTSAPLDPGATHSLRGHWRFQPGDDPARAAPEFDDSRWGTVSLPSRWPEGGYPDHGQMGWYRLTLRLDNAAPFSHKLERLGVRIGRIRDAHEVYAGGQLLGGVGRLPPLAEPDYDREQVYAVPASAIAADGTLVLALRVWGGDRTGVRTLGGGAYGGRFLLGDYATLTRGMMNTDLPVLALCALFMAFGVYHIYLFATTRHRQVNPYLWFGLMSVAVSVYSFMLTRWKYLLDWPFGFFEKLEITTICLLPALVIQMVWSMLDEPIGRLLRAYQFSFLLAVFVVASVPDVGLLGGNLFWWQLWCGPVLALTPVLVSLRAFQGHREARILLLGVLVFAACCVNDILLSQMHVEGVRLLPFGFAAMMVAMAGSLANRFTTMLDDLEREVSERTAQLAEANAKLSRAAVSDSLTGVYNRRGIMQLAEAEQRRARRSGRSFSVLLVDVDKFKDFNDNFGHACGDFVLQRVAGLLGDELRDVDRLGRWGGEEFIILLPETSDSGAALLAERLRDQLARSAFDYGDEQVRVTATFGVANHRHDETLEQCIARADVALYHGKRSGRNCVSVASPVRLSAVT